MVLKREDILAGKVEEQIREAERQGLVSRLSPAQRQASKRALLDAIGDGEIWLFGYGSLMWNPCIHSVDRQPAGCSASIRPGRSGVPRPVGERRQKLRR